MFPFRFLSSPSVSSWRALARLWMLGVLLPFLLLSVTGNVPHEHELHALSALIQRGSSAEKTGFAPSLQKASPSQTRAQSSVLRAAPASVHPGENLCLLCQWASVIGALLVVALALSWLVTRVAVRVFDRSVPFSFAPLALRSRAPPV